MLFLDRPGQNGENTSAAIERGVWAGIFRSCRGGPGFPENLKFGREIMQSEPI